MTEPRDRAPDEPLESAEPLEPLEPADDDLADEVVRDIDAELDTDDIDGKDDVDGEDEAIDADEADPADIDDYDAAIRQVAGQDVPAATAPERRTSAQRRADGKTTTRAPSPSEIAVHVREDWSRAFVIIAVAVFVAILLNGILLGTGGLLRPIATPTPIPTESPSPSPSTSASPSGAASRSASPVASPVAS